MKQPCSLGGPFGPLMEKQGVLMGQWSMLGHSEAADNRLFLEYLLGFQFSQEPKIELANLKKICNCLSFGQIDLFAEEKPQQQQLLHEQQDFIFLGYNILNLLLLERMKSLR